MESAEATARRIVERCREIGFAAAGVCEARATEFARELREWLGAGKHGSMEYLARHEALRVDPIRVLPGARSIIVVADLYHARGVRGNTACGHGAAGHEPGSFCAAPSASSSRGPSGRVARYARGRDYHEVIKGRLHALADELRAAFPCGDFRAFVDTAPVLEREHAARAGLGWVGKHTLLIHPRLGSYTLLGGVLTTLELAPASEQRVVADHCGTCTRCIDACPTGAISAYSVDASRCIAYLTIERRGAIDPAFHEAIGYWIFGCDVCQEVCPHNSAREGDVAGDGAGERERQWGEANPAYAPRREGFDLLAVLGWTEEDRRREFSGTALKRATLEMMKRNAIVALGNAALRGEMDRRTLVERLRLIASNPLETALVREAAHASLRRLGA